MKTNVVVLACGNGGCCPSVEDRGAEGIVIHDQDDGRDQHVVLNPKQTELLYKELLKRFA